MSFIKLLELSIIFRSNAKMGNNLIFQWPRGSPGRETLSHKCLNALDPAWKLTLGKGSMRKYPMFTVIFLMAELRQYEGASGRGT